MDKLRVHVSDIRRMYRKSNLLLSTFSFLQYFVYFMKDIFKIQNMMYKKKIDYLANNKYLDTIINNFK